MAYALNKIKPRIFTFKKDEEYHWFDPQPHIAIFTTQELLQNVRLERKVQVWKDSILHQQYYKTTTTLIPSDTWDISKCYCGGSWIPVYANYLPSKIHQQPTVFEMSTCFWILNIHEGCVIRQARPFSFPFKDWDSKASSFNNLLEREKCRNVVFRAKWAANPQWSSGQMINCTHRQKTWTWHPT